MKFTRKRSIFSLVALAMTGSMAMAQEEPAPAATPAQEEAPAPAPKLNTLRLRYTSSGIYDNRFRAQHHGFLASGLQIDELTFLSPGSEIAHYGRLAAHGLGSRDYWVGTQAILAGGATQLYASAQHRTYYHVALAPTDRSSDTINEVGASHSFGNVGVYASFRDSQRRVGLDAPKPTHKPRAQRLAGGVDATFGAVSAGMVAAQTRYTEGSGLQPNSVLQTVGGHVSSDIGDRFSISGVASFSRIQQQNWATSRSKSLGLVANLDLNDTSTLQFDLSRTDVSLPNTLSAYDRQRFSTGGRLMTRLGAWSFQAGYHHVEAEHVRADRTFVDVPKWNVFDFRLGRRMGEGTRLTLRGKWDDLRSSAIPNTNDTRQLLWDDKAMLQGKLDMISGGFAGYASYTFRFRQNKQRGVKLDWHNLALGASHQFTDKVSGYGEISYDVFRGGNGAAAITENLRSYFPNSANVGMGVTYVPNTTSSVSAAITTFSTNNLWGSQLTLSYRRDISPDRYLQLEVAPWSTRDRLYGQTGYRTTMFSLSYTMKF